MHINLLKAPRTSEANQPILCVYSHFPPPLTSWCLVTPGLFSNRFPLHLLSSASQEWKWGSERLNDLPTTVQLGSARTSCSLSKSKVLFSAAGRNHLLYTPFWRNNLDFINRQDGLLGLHCLMIFFSVMRKPESRNGFFQSIMGGRASLTFRPRCLYLIPRAQGSCSGTSAIFFSYTCPSLQDQSNAVRQTFPKQRRQCPIAVLPNLITTTNMWLPIT